MSQPGASSDTPYSNMIPSQNDGTVIPTIDNSRTARPAAGERSAAMAQPSGTDSSTAAARPSTVSSTVTPAAAAISASTGRPVVRLVPKSPRSIRPIQRTYCRTND